MTAPPWQWRRTQAREALATGAVAQAWDRLNGARGDLPFLDSHALRHALEAFGTGRECLFSAEERGVPRAMFILVPKGAWRWTTFQASQIPLGAWVAAAGLELTDLARDLIDRALGACLVLSITQVDPLHAPRRADDARLDHADYIDTGWVELQGSFEDYWAARGKNLRQNMRKQRNKLAAEGTSVRMRVIQDPADIGPALARYGALESAGWKAEGGTAIQVDNQQGRFYLSLFRDAATRGEALFHEYLFEDRTVAMNLCLRRARQLVVLKTAYDESIKTLSPAFLLREDELKALFAAGTIDRMEYYGRLMDWHTRLTDRHRAIYHLTVFRFAWLKQLALRRRRTQARAVAPVVAEEGAT